METKDISEIGPTPVEGNKAGERLHSHVVLADVVRKHTAHAWARPRPSHIHSFCVRRKEPREEVLVLTAVVREGALKLMAGG